MFVKHFYGLPHPKTLAKWYSSVDAKLGFTAEAFDFLKLKVKNLDRRIIFLLVFDEIAMTKHLQFKGNEYHEYVDCGSAWQEHCMELATETLVFMLICINEPRKLPIGYLFLKY